MTKIWNVVFWLKIIQVVFVSIKITNKYLQTLSGIIQHDGGLHTPDLIKLQVNFQVHF